MAERSRSGRLRIADNDTAGEDRVGQAAEPGEGDGAVGLDLFGLDGLALDDTPARLGAPPVTGIEEAADLFVVLGLGSKIVSISS